MKLAWQDDVPPGAHFAIQGGLQARVWEAAGAWRWGIWGRSGGKVALWDTEPEAPHDYPGQKRTLTQALGEAATREAAIAACEHAIDTAAVVTARWET